MLVFIFLLTVTETQISLQSYLQYPLPIPEYSDNTPGRSISIANPKKPTHVFLWTNFESLVVEWVNQHNVTLSSSMVDIPTFVPRIISEEVQTLQPYIKDNLLDISVKYASTLFKNIRESRQTIGEPDYIMTRDSEIVAIVEIKGKWTLTNPDIVGIYERDRFTSSAVNQLYHYMRLNHRKYGILSSYENTWFVYRSQECDLCSDLSIEIHETLYISIPFNFNARNPTIQQCFNYFDSIVDGCEIPSPPSSRPNTRSSSRPNSGNNSPSLIRPIRDPHQNSNQMERSNSKSSLYDREFEIDQFEIISLIGEGRSKVYLAKYSNMQVALKVADISKQRDLLAELHNEVDFYYEFESLQGHCIPRLLFHGLLEGLLYCVGLSLGGSVPTRLNNTQKRKLTETLELIHEKGFLHNDIKSGNVLVDDEGNIALVDFGFAREGCIEEQILEKSSLLKYLESV